MKNKKILVIEDEAELSKILRLRFEKLGFTVETALSGEAGLAKVKTYQPDLITLDVKMPGMNGYKVCKLLKADEKTKQIPVLMLTVRVTEIERKEGLAAGADAYLTKPYEGQLLLETVKKLLKLK